MPFFDDSGVHPEEARGPIWGAFATLADQIERMIALNIGWALQQAPGAAALMLIDWPIWVRLPLAGYSALALAPATGVLYALIARACDGEMLRWESVVIPAANRAPMAGELTDIALVTGASLLCAAAGRSARRAAPSDLGGARRVVLAPQALTIVGGHGQVQNPVAIQRRIAELRAHMNRHHCADPAWENLRLRAGRLAGGVGILKIGAHTATERALLKDAVRKTIRVLDQAIMTGVVPGGGVAYLNCIAPTLAERRKCADDDERRGVEVLARALEAPFLQIVRNDKRLHPPLALTLARERGGDVGFDVRRGEFVDMRQAGVMDCLGVLQGALESAASAAVTVITASALVFTGRRSADLKP